MSDFFSKIKDSFSKAGNTISNLSKIAELRKILNHPKMQNFLQSLTEEQKKLIQSDFSNLDFSEKSIEKMKKILTSNQIITLQELMNSEEIKKILNN